MSTTYYAHIVTAEATDLGDPAVIVIADDGQPGGRLEYSAELPPRLAFDAVVDHLEDQGWRLAGRVREAATGYYVVPVSNS